MLCYSMRDGHSMLSTYLVVCRLAASKRLYITIRVVSDWVRLMSLSIPIEYRQINLNSSGSSVDSANESLGPLKRQRSGA